ncbi:uncharacterized protein [Musca autumnalis]|uniref:uncharacterized protein n=1 Tax=Musca autumnalis TaxID=221902 RepID=UPI003CF19CE5
MDVGDLSDHSASTENSMLIEPPIKMKKVKRSKWTSKEIEAVKSTFGELSTLKTLPSLKECNDLIINTDCLRNRMAARLKTWIDNQRKQLYRKNNSTLSPNSSAI